VTPPHGLQAILERFGDPRRPGFERENIVLCPIAYPLVFERGDGSAAMTGVIRVHKLVAPIFTEVFKDIRARGLIEKASKYGGAYTVRKIRGSTTGRLSTHSWGIAIDINPKENPLGAEPKLDAAVVQCFVQHGFTWGGVFRRKDGMHFQYASGY
jgi:hypothetical protein